MKTFTIVIVFLLKRSKLSPNHKIKFDQLQNCRKLYDQAFERWEPHLTLIPPFNVQASSRLSTSCESQSPRSKEADGSTTEKEDLLDRDEISTLLEAALSPLYEECRKACSLHKKHRIVLGQIGTFRPKSYTTLHLKPDGSEGRESIDGKENENDGEERLMDLQRDLKDAYSKSKQKVPIDQSDSKARMDGKGGSQADDSRSTIRSTEGQEVSTVSTTKKSQSQSASNLIHTNKSSKRSSGKSFRPHLTLGQYSDRGWKSNATKVWRKAEELIDKKLNGVDKSPIEVVVDKIQIMWKEAGKGGPYEVWKEVELSS